MFLSVLENIVVLCPSFDFSVVFAHAHIVLLTTQKSHRAQKNFMPGHYMKIMPAQQPIRAHVLFMFSKYRLSEEFFQMGEDSRESVHREMNNFSCIQQVKFEL